MGMEAQLDGGTNSSIFIFESYLHAIIYTTGKTTQVSGGTGVWAFIGLMGDGIISVYSSYLIKDNPQNTIFMAVIKKYNDSRSVLIEILRWLKLTNSEGRSTRI